MSQALDTLQEMILAAHADGDAELAAWLAERGDDPEALAELTAGEATGAEHGEALESEGGHRREGEVWRGGTGRWYTMKNGRPVPAKGPQAGAPRPAERTGKPGDGTNTGGVKKPAPIHADPVGLPALRSDARGLSLDAFLDRHAAERAGDRVPPPHDVVRVADIDPSEADDWSEVGRGETGGEEKVARIAEAVGRGEPITPVLLRGTADHPELRPQVTDGHHRVAGAIRAEATAVPVYYDEETLRELWRAANAGGARPAPAPGRTESEAAADADASHRWLLEHGFSGTITDAAGRKQRYVDGEHVGSGDAGADARTPPTGNTPDPAEAETAAADAHHDALPAAERGRLARVKDKLVAKLEGSRGGRAVLALGRGGLAIFHAVERRLMYAAVKVQEVAAEAAKERGLSEEAATKLRHALHVADFFGGYATGGAALAVAGPIAAKVAAVMPSVSVAYLAYSTARNPLATLRAAKKVVAATFARTATESESDPIRVGPELAGMLADRIGRSDLDSDWYVALFCAALAHTGGDAMRAVELADAAVEAEPEGPADDETEE